MKKIEMAPLKTPPKGLFKKTDPFLMSVGTTVNDIPLDKLIPFANHPFSLYTGEKLADLMESIKANGVMVPVIIRPVVLKIDVGDQYEILSGHNRVNAARLAGLDRIPAIVRECTDDEAILIVTTTNLLQRQYSEMTHSERAAVLSAHHAAIKQQGRRSDLIKEIENILNASNGAENSTSSPLGNLTSMNKTGAKYALSKNTVARYLRVNMLIASLKECLDGGEFGVRVAVSLSYLPEETQQHIVDVLTTTDYKLDMNKAGELKMKLPTTREGVERILAGQKPKRPTSFRLKPKLVSKYFTSTATQKEIESTLVAALDLYFAQRKGE